MHNFTYNVTIKIFLCRNFIWKVLNWSAIAMNNTHTAERIMMMKHEYSTCHEYSNEVLQCVMATKSDFDVPCSSSCQQFSSPRLE